MHDVAWNLFISKILLFPTALRVYLISGNRES